MGLPHAIAVVVILLGLYRAAEGIELPILLGDRLSLETDIPGATDVNCSVAGTQYETGKVVKNWHLDSALRPETFAKYGFTARPMSVNGYLKIDQSTHSARFTFAEVVTYSQSVVKSRMYALQVNPQGMSAYWLPQGGSINIPGRPTGNEPRYVFTPDFSGCAWTVTPLNNGKLRLRHVQGGHEGREFNDLSTRDRGGLNSYAMQYLDYGFFRKSGRIFESRQAFAYMHFTGTDWKLHLQRRACAPTPGSVQVKNDLMTSMSWNDWPSIFYKPVEGTAEFRVSLL